MIIKTNSGKIHISEGNKKVGDIKSFSLPPVISCDPKYCKECEKYCYAKKAYRQYKGTKAAYDDNFDVVQKDLLTFTDSMVKYFSGVNSPRVFRVHVSGDFFSVPYLLAWVTIAKRAKGSVFYSYTKSFDVFNTFFKMGYRLPKNLVIRLSANADCNYIPCNISADLPLAFVRKGVNYDYFDDSFICPAKHKTCAECGLCWKVRKNVIFDIH